MNASRCKSCHRAILWAVTEKGRRVPLDPEPTPEGRFMLEGETAINIGQAHLADGIPRYDSHFASCPHAGAWRRRNEKDG